LKVGFHTRTAKPKGLGGSFSGWFGSHQKWQLAEWAISLLNIQPYDRVLEIGSGSGIAVQLAARHCTLGLVCGIESDPIMIRRARRRNKLDITCGRVVFAKKSVPNLPYADRSFDKAFSINRVQFSPHLLRDLKELHRVLRPAGKLLIVRQPLGAKNKVEETEMREDIQQRLPQQIAMAGFDVLRTEVRAMKSAPAYCIVGSKIPVEGQRRYAIVDNREESWLLPVTTKLENS
jgi:SAM-dependent methyltransferase